MAHPDASRPVPVTASAAVPRRTAIILYSTVTLLYWVALYVYVPTLPNYVKTKTADLALVGSALSMYGLWQGLVRFPIGLAADRLGRRKPFILAGLFLTGLGAWVMGRATGIEGVFTGRAITGLAAGAWVPMIAAFSGLFPAGEALRASALVALLGTLGSVAGTATTGWLNELGGWGLPFLLATIIAGLGLGLGFCLPETPRAPSRPSLGHVGRLVLRRDVLLPSLLCAAAHYVLMAATYGFLPILARNLGMGNVAQSMLTSLNLGLMTVGNLGVATLNRRFGARTLNYTCFAILSLGLAVAALSAGHVTLFLSQALLGLGQGIGYPVQMGLSIRRVDGSERTTALGVFASVYAVGMFSGPAVSGVLANWIGIQPMFAVTAAACLAVGILGTRTLKA